MMKEQLKYKLVSLVFTVLIFQFKIHAQDYKNDILAVNKTLLSQKNYSLQLNYKMYLDNNLKTPFQERKVKLLRQNKNLLMKQNEDLEVVKTGKYHIYLDHHDKMISVVLKDKEEEDLRQEALKLLDVYIDSLPNICEKIKVIYNDENTVKYECILKPNDEVSFIWVEIDKKTKFYRSIVTRYKKPTKVRELNNEEHYLTLKIEYSSPVFNPNISSTVFNELTYLQIKDKKILGLADKYKSYKYFNNPN